MSQIETAEPVRSVNGTQLPAPGTYVLDRSHTDVGFTVRHLMVSKVRGSFRDFEGTLTIGPSPEESSVEVQVELASIDTRDQGRDEHLRSPDFFHVANHPTMTFRSTAVTPVGGSRYRVDGELTIKDVTRPVTLDVEFSGAATDPWGGSRIGFSATAEIDREEFGLTWNAPLETGGVVVGKTVKINLEVEAVLQA